jgi:hypothetical protein
MDKTNAHLRCVKCGEIVEQEDFYFAASQGLPCCCVMDRAEVMEEVLKDFPMWPHGWYGHAWKSSGDSDWRYDEWVPNNAPGWPDEEA